MINTENKQEERTVDDVIISLHDIARHVDKFHGLGLISHTIRLCADDLNEINKRTKKY